MRFPEFFLWFRCQAGLSIHEVSRALRVQSCAVSDWESGVSLPSEKTMVAIAHLFRMRLRDYSRMKKLMERNRGHLSMLQRRIPPILSMKSLYIPLISEQTNPLPVEEIKDPSQWKGLRCHVATDTRASLPFAFIIPDGSMEPKYRQGDIVICDARKQYSDHLSVIVKIAGQPACCRLCLYQRGGKRVFLANDPSMNPIRANGKTVQWCCPVIEPEN